ncbi:SAV_915 family protein [Nocardia goodfellowii]|uniref:Uncharacterized protein n=1 Tax=Nocardia goodfellowii TaxID=882446 RepID=A0ABS4QGL5_9NOCA|nr:SAV_915 family protein [Nocardia goodfellowii]MBP2190837.1 hypothetical protein [Nocardia goodfellowii]
MAGQPFYNHYDDPDEDWDEVPLRPTPKSSPADAAPSRDVAPPASYSQASSYGTPRSESAPYPADPTPPAPGAPARPDASAIGMRPAPKPMPKNFPPVVYLPVLAEVQEIEDAQIMMRKTRDGRIACMAYSALDRLHECCGSDQPWMWTTTVSLDALYQARPFDILLLDVFIPEEHRGNPRA